ncbi:hypothetical protein MRB53_042067 [Persea americana]|nr:hypothetical protein MRB53_042067 [Persea americana]
MGQSAASLTAPTLVKLHLASSPACWHRKQVPLPGSTTEHFTFLCLHLLHWEMVRDVTAPRMMFRPWTLTARLLRDVERPLRVLVERGDRTDGRCDERGEVDAAFAFGGVVPGLSRLTELDCTRSFSGSFRELEQGGKGIVEECGRRNTTAARLGRLARGNGQWLSRRFASRTTNSGWAGDALQQRECPWTTSNQNGDDAAAAKGSLQPHRPKWSIAGVRNAMHTMISTDDDRAMAVQADREAVARDITALILNSDTADRSADTPDPMQTCHYMRSSWAAPVNSYWDDGDISGVSSGMPLRLAGRPVLTRASQESRRRREFAIQSRGTITATQLAELQIILRAALMSVILETSVGDIVVDLLVKEAPRSCEKYVMRLVSRRRLQPYPCSKRSKSSDLQWSPSMDLSREQSHADRTSVS